MKKCWIVWAALAVCIPPLQAQAQDAGNWIVRARAVNLDPANKDSTGLGLSVNSKVFPEVDFTVFFSPNVAAELILTYPQKHDLRSNGAVIGSLKHLPPVLTLQYHFTGMDWRPYVGIGLNYTHFSSVRFTPAVEAALKPSIDKNRFGAAFNVGVDAPLGGGWLFNLDVKKVKLDPHVASFGHPLGRFRVDPVLVGVGLGKRF